MQALEPKYCEQCGMSFLRAVGSKLRFCRAHHEFEQACPPEKPSERRVRLADELLNAIATEGITSARAVELSDEIRTLNVG